MKPRILNIFVLIFSLAVLCCGTCWAEQLLEKQAVGYFKEAIAEQNGGDLDFAVSLYKKAIYARPNFKQAYNNLGTVYMQKGDLRTAEEHLRLAIKIDSNYSTALINLSIIYAERKDYDKFFEYWKKANGLDIYSSFIIDEEISE